MKLSQSYDRNNYYQSFGHRSSIYCRNGEEKKKENVFCETATANSDFNDSNEFLLLFFQLSDHSFHLPENRITVYHQMNVLKLNFNMQLHDSKFIVKEIHHFICK